MNVISTHLQVLLKRPVDCLKPVMILTYGKAKYDRLIVEIQMNLFVRTEHLVPGNGLAKPEDTVVRVCHSWYIIGRFPGRTEGARP